MDITKRNGRQEDYDGQKIITAMKKAFESTGSNPAPSVMADLLVSVEEKLTAKSITSVEGIQDQVEQTLMEQGFFTEAKNYILYRQKRSLLRDARAALCEAASDPALEFVFRNIQKDFPGEEYSLLHLSAKYNTFCKPEMKTEEKLTALIKAAVELTTQEAPRWEFIAARLLNYQAHKAIASRMEEARITCFYEKLRYLTDLELYGSYILEQYSREELEEASLFLDDTRDGLFTYAGLDLLLKRYCIRTKNHILLETPQEMYLGIALHLAMKEKQNRMNWVKKFYDCLSRMEVTMATPTLPMRASPTTSFPVVLSTPFPTAWRASTGVWIILPR